MRDNISEIVDGMYELIQSLTPAECNRMSSSITKINKNLKDIIEQLNRGIDQYMMIDDNPEKHVYYVNNLYAKAQLQKLVPPNANIRVDPEVQIGNIIFIKQY